MSPNKRHSTTLQGGVAAHARFELRGIVKHLGAANGGHYVSYVNKTWYLTNDGTVTRVRRAGSDQQRLLSMRGSTSSCAPRAPRVAQVGPADVHAGDKHLLLYVRTDDGHVACVAPLRSAAVIAALAAAAAAAGADTAAAEAEASAQAAAADAATAATCSVQLQQPLQQEQRLQQAPHQKLARARAPTKTL